MKTTVFSRGMHHKREFLLVLIFIALIIRFYHFGQNGFMYHDESIMTRRAGYLNSVLFRPMAQVSVPSDYVDSKIGWLGFLMLIQKIFPSVLLGGQFLSIVMGAVSVWLMFRFVFSLFRSSAMAYLSAMFLLSSPMHIIYSRTALPETTAMVFVLLCLLQYLKGLKYLMPGRAFSAGLLLSFAFLVIRYRVMGVLIFTILLHCFVTVKDRGVILKNFPDAIRQFKYFFIFLVGTVILPLLYIGVQWICAQRDMYLPSYLQGFRISLGAHRFQGIDFSSFREYLYFLARFEGFLVIPVMVFGFLFLRRSRTILFPFLVILSALILYAFADETAPRNLTPILPFVSLWAAIVFYKMTRLLKRSNLKFFFVIIFFAFLAERGGLIKNVLQFHSGFPFATRWISQQVNSRFLTTNPEPCFYSDQCYATFAWWPDVRYDKKTFEDANLRYFLFDLNTAIQYEYNKRLHWNPGFNRFVDVLRKQCEPVKTVGHMTDFQVELAVWEANRVYLNIPDVIKSIGKRGGGLHIYDLEECLK